MSKTTTNTATKAAPKEEKKSSSAKVESKKPETKSSSPQLSVPFTAVARPLISVHKLDSDELADQLTLPAVFIAPIRLDIVNFVHSQMSKNGRQPYAVFADAGHQHSAESWGTGRAVARIPRVSGGGTSRAGQAAFGNMCRKGHMFNPTKVWRRWHRRINLNQKRFATASALAASALPSLVEARGHRISSIPEIPLVIDNSIESVNKTKTAINALKKIGAFEDIEKVRDSKKLRAGKGKTRNRRYLSRRGPLVVYNEDHGISTAFRNIPGVEVVHVDRLNLLSLAPGGHLGRLIVWSKGAFAKLNANWGNYKSGSRNKSGFKLPRPQLGNSDLTRIINSDEIQSVVRPKIEQKREFKQKKNPLKNLGARVRLNPFYAVQRRAAVVGALARKDTRRKAAKSAEAVKKNKTIARKAAKKVHSKNTKHITA